MNVLRREHLCDIIGGDMCGGRVLVLLGCADYCTKVAGDQPSYIP